MTLLKKLQIPEEGVICVLNQPSDLRLGLMTIDDPKKEGVLLFARNSKELGKLKKAIVRST